MKVVIFIAVFAISFVNANVLCNLCLDLIHTLEKLLTEDHIKKVEKYIDILCTRATGVFGALCSIIVDFGLEKLVELIQNKVDASEICQTVHAC
ncbi:Invapore A [Entamoeba marina]